MQYFNTNICEIDRVLDKHKAFWYRKKVDKPLVQKFQFAGFKEKPYPLSNGTSVVKPTHICPDQVDVQRLLGMDKRCPSPFEGNKINCVGPVFPEAWMESLVGCPIYASAFSCTAKTITNNFSLDNAFQSSWLKTMDSVIENAVSFAEGEVGVRQLHMRGIIDILAAVFGEEMLCLSLYDANRHLNELSRDFVRLYTEVAFRGLAMRPPWNGGYVSTWGLFAPGTLIDYQADASGLIAPELYKEFFIKYDSSIISKFEYSIMHVHCCGLHVLKAVLEIKDLDAIEISLDRETGDWDIEKTIEYCKLVQTAGKSVLIYGQLSKGELEKLLADLSPVGLAIFYWDECDKTART